MPFITISRMYGSGGSEVAERVAQAFGWPLFDNALIDAVAERSGLSTAEVTAQEERVPSMVERLAAALSLGSPEVMPPIPANPIETPEERIVDMTRRVIEEAVQTGPAVFVGRGAQCLLAERSDAFHVFCYAPHDSLRDFAMQKYDIGREEADRRVAEMNRQREQYVKRHWNRKWLSPSNYHLCANTGWLGIERVAELVVQTAQEYFSMPPHR